MSVRSSTWSSNAVIRCANKFKRHQRSSTPLNGCYRDEDSNCTFPLHELDSKPKFKSKPDLKHEYKLGYKPQFKSELKPTFKPAYRLSVEMRASAPNLSVPMYKMQSDILWTMFPCFLLHKVFTEWSGGIKQAFNIWTISKPFIIHQEPIKLPVLGVCYLVDGPWNFICQIWETFALETAEIKGESHFSVLPLPLRLTPSPCP